MTQGSWSKAQTSKCEFFKQKMMYLGHVISNKGIQTNPKKVEVIQKWPIPTSITEVCSFLGLNNYYCKFIKKYAQVAKPLYQLVSGENVGRNEIQLGGIMGVRKLLTKLKSCAPAHQFCFGICIFQETI